MYKIVIGCTQWEPLLHSVQTFSITKKRTELLNCADRRSENDSVHGTETLPLFEIFSISPDHFSLCCSFNSTHKHTIFLNTHFISQRIKTHTRAHIFTQFKFTKYQCSTLRCKRCIFIKTFYSRFRWILNLTISHIITYAVEFYAHFNEYFRLALFPSWILLFVHTFDCKAKINIST